MKLLRGKVRESKTPYVKNLRVVTVGSLRDQMESDRVPVFVIRQQGAATNVQTARVSNATSKLKR